MILATLAAVALLAYIGKMLLTQNRSESLQPIRIKVEDNSPRGRRRH
jgi:hypothetical protein